MENNRYRGTTLSNRTFTDVTAWRAIDRVDRSLNRRIKGYGRKEEGVGEIIRQVEVFNRMQHEAVVVEPASPQARIGGEIHSLKEQRKNGTMSHADYRRRVDVLRKELKTI